MIRILKADDRQRVPDLFEQMFVDRAAIFHNRLRWNVHVRNGKEIDHLDYSGQPIYVVHVDEKDHVTGSLRILPSNGDILLKSSYADQFKLDPTLFHPDIWECSRFYVNPGAARRMQTKVSALLLAGLCEYSLSNDIKGILGFFDRPMMRIYEKLGWVPTTIAQSCDRAETFVGKWVVSTDALGKLRRGFGK